jgi:hypothetical protein
VKARVYSVEKFHQLEDENERLKHSLNVENEISDRAERELDHANFFRDRLARRLGLVETAVVELESALSCDSTHDSGHWRDHVGTALDLCRRATKKRAAC